MVKIELGDEVKDSISEFKGIATGRAEYLTGCVQIHITAKGTGGMPIGEWIDEQRLVVTKAGAYDLPEEEVKEAPAGPQNVPPARHP